MVFLPVQCWRNRSCRHSGEDLNCFLYPQLPFITLAAGYFYAVRWLKPDWDSARKVYVEGKKFTNGSWIGRWDTALRSSTEWAPLCPNQACGGLCLEQVSTLSSQLTATETLKSDLKASFWGVVCLESQLDDSSFIVSRKGAETMDAADLSDKLAGS